MGQHGHSSEEDAVTAMELYRLVEVQWEQQVASSRAPRGQRARRQHGRGAVHAGPVLAGGPGPGHPRRRGGGAAPEGVRAEKLPWGVGTGRAPGAGRLAAPAV